MSGDECEPVVLSIAERIAALNNRCEKAVVPPPPPPSAPPSSASAPKSDALASRIAALQRNSKNSTIEVSEKPKVGKLKPQDGAPTIPFGSGPPPSLIKKQKEREERMEKLQQEAKSMDAELGDSASGEGTKSKVGKVKLPAGAVPIMAFGAGPPPPLLLRKQREREELMEKLREEARLTDEDESGAT